MYAVIESGGKQYRVAEGDSLLVDRLSAAEGDSVELRPVFFRGDEVIADPGGLAKVSVAAEVTEHLRGEKLRIFKYKAKKGYRRRAGYRSELTRLKVTGVTAGGAKPKKAAAAKPKTDKAEPKPKAGAKAEKSDAKPKAEKAEAKPKAAAKPKDEKPKAQAKPKADAKTKAKPKATKSEAKPKKPAAKPKSKPSKEKSDGA